MPIQVEFRGPMLFLTHQDTVPKVLVPNAEVRPDVGKNNGTWTHYDGASAKQHFSRLIVLDDKDRIAARIGLPSMQLTIEDSSAGACAMNPSFRGVLALDSIVAAGAGGGPLTLIPSSDSDFDSRVATTIDLAGGTLRAGAISNAVWRWPPGGDLTSIPMATVWEPNVGSAARIRVLFRNAQGINATIDLSTEYPRAIVYNYDEPEPTLKELYADVEPSAGIFPDHDFKWIYRLFDPTNGDWDAWLAAHGNHLPAPTLDMSRPAVQAAAAINMVKMANVIPPHPIVGSCYHPRLEQQ